MMSDKSMGSKTDGDGGTKRVYTSCPDCLHDERLTIDPDVLVVDVECAACGYEFTTVNELESR